MSKMPTGFVAKCLCGEYVAVTDLPADVTLREEAGRKVSRWLFKGHTVEPRFGEWVQTCTPCKCPQQGGFNEF